MTDNVKMLEPLAISSDFETVSGRLVMTGAVFTSVKEPTLIRLDNFQCDLSFTFQIDHLMVLTPVCQKGKNECYTDVFAE